MEPRMLQLLFVLHVLAFPVQLCEIPRGNPALIKCLNMELLRLSQDLSEELNPSVYLALRLSADHSLEKEAQYLQRLKNVFQPSASSSKAGGQQKQPNTGRLALYLLALRAACQDMERLLERRLVTRLKHHLHKEKEQIAFKRNGRPITSYYQYSLGVLALCVHGKKIDSHVIQKLLNAEQHNKFTHGSKLSVDTTAMAGLAFACLKQANLYEPKLVAAISLAVQRVTNRILQAQTTRGTFGNIFSSPLAMQLLIATRMSKKPVCPKGMDALLGSLEQGHFQNPMIMSQLLPVLDGKSYLDIATMECQAEQDTLELDTQCPGARTVILGTKMIIVQLAVEHPPNPETLYNHSIQVLSGSSLQDMLRTAAEQGPGHFTFETQNTLHGPFLAAVMGVKASNGERRYWQLLQAPDTSLQKGISDYHPQDGESIILKFSPW
ncbi:transcobalamin-2 [Gopherus evgoodei]|uniref:Transcobalamin-2 n=1 Tax=Gopherus evgoodei TaxID=1825980 RepID=A0A8C4YIT1_9SAUR|nr:transcobalamin-2 [Gopherus evgoodei]XP_030438317.1 transcobalamin-2 [Gopherus evgoodei]XP_030438318.1 transcobalamin-2 [Gopherus evgoodei]XP_030438319.1 transcobalamin-2 [Gopherus evgoodei]XP_030438320.1 transcobalamin-2 [Gopherus evgoodei]XP_030438321.1 transcobalamin-2 [Gopherus evgoodei]XP_030438322.1 transcobalamin-2 [Gopherus evgoodei]